MPSGHSSSSHSSSSSGSSSGGSSSGYSGGSSGGSDHGGHSYHDNDNYYREHDSIFPFHIQGILWFIGIAALFVVILLKVNIKDELNKNSNTDNAVIYGTVNDVGYSGTANTASNNSAATAETSRRSTQSFKKYSPGYGIVHDRIYVPEIGRECTYDANSDNYYDKDTGCYFWLNNDVTPPIWQYWYQGISSDYGDYGWMEYDYDKQCWFIETEKGKWEELPSYYNTDNLWHMDKPAQGRYYGQDSIYVPALGRNCPYKEYVSSYYDEETNTYFYYNSYLRPAQWLYWYEDYGWLMYDSQNAKWYRLDENLSGVKWAEMPSDWNDPKVWHLDSN